MERIIDQDTYFLYKISVNPNKCFVIEDKDFEECSIYIEYPINGEVWVGERLVENPCGAIQVPHGFSCVVKAYNNMVQLWWCGTNKIR